MQWRKQQTSLQSKRAMNQICRFHNETTNHFHVCTANAKTMIIQCYIYKTTKWITRKDPTMFCTLVYYDSNSLVIFFQYVLVKWYLKNSSRNTFEGLLSLRPYKKCEWGNVKIRSSRPDFNLGLMCSNDCKINGLNNQTTACLLERFWNSCFIQIAPYTSPFMSCPSC